MITQQSDSPNNKNRTTNPLSQMFQNIFSDNSNIMLAAIISLLLVILFVLLLHLYAKWFLAQAQAQAHARRRRRRLRRATVTVSDVLGPARFHHFHSFNIEDSPISSINTKGLDSAIIAAIPIFIYAASEPVKGGDNKNDDIYDDKQNKVELEHELECVICLSAFEDGEMGRCLPKCGHGFHVECIDMWLNTHSNCPICRAPIVVGGIVEVIQSNDPQLGSVDGLDHDHDHDHVHDDDDSSAFVEVVVDDVITPTISEIRESDQSGNENGVMSGDSVSETSSSNLMVGCSLKRMLSKVFPSSNVNELQA